MGGQGTRTRTAGSIIINIVQNFWHCCGIAGLDTTAEHGLAGACCDAWSAPVGDAFKAYDEGIISACNQPARDRGVEIGMTVKDAAFALLSEKE